jgi:hypothetical protein
MLDAYIKASAAKQAMVSQRLATLERVLVKLHPSAADAFLPLSAVRGMQISLLGSDSSAGESTGVTSQLPFMVQKEYRGVLQLVIVLQQTACMAACNVVSTKLGSRPQQIRSVRRHVLMALLWLSCNRDLPWRRHGCAAYHQRWPCTD